MARLILTTTRDFLIIVAIVCVALVAVAALGFALFYLAAYGVAWLIWA
ncbi:hypothetical protein [Williamsia sterculiae]|uniref:Uncharacterized protein n=1 Tax=Williamsia sterculiae TaxID=1344003 RepID=A0A1N7GHM3_9NOCA|nr:hypothetical protein [Williamsia sterculiae]SIS12087.1 hypothetical protein SAMN05445060_2801 [Williamsia sterculiae]